MGIFFLKYDKSTLVFYFKNQAKINIIAPTISTNWIILEILLRIFNITMMMTKTINIEKITVSSSRNID